MTDLFNDVWVYDWETFPNIACVQFLQAISGDWRLFEISTRRNDAPQLFDFLDWQWRSKQRLAGFNCLEFDYPITHDVLVSRGIGIDHHSIYQKSQSIIGSVWSDVPPWDVLIPQIDLFKIHHFDNKAKLTSLKALQFNMRSKSIEDLPFAVGTLLDSTQMDALISYNFHDITETLKFLYESRPQIQFRADLSAEYGKDFTNDNDTKIGKQYFIQRLEEAAPGSCYVPGTRTPRQTIRNSVAIGDVIFPYVAFGHPELQRVLQWYRDQTINENEKPSISCTVDGFTFYFGIGGIHGSVSSSAYFISDDRVIWDIDVSGYYPSLAIANRLRPEHLGEMFCSVYEDIVRLRGTYPKGSPANGMLKLAGNGVYGDSHNPYSPFFDLRYMLAITVNGQLLLAMLAEQMMRVPGLQLLQINTDGITCSVPRSMLEHCREVAKWWEAITRLRLEENFYTSIFIRDANSYLAVSEKKTKRKNACSWVRGLNLSDGELAWHQDHSSLIVPMAAEAVVLEGADPAEFIYGHRDIYDFCIKAKANRGSRLELADGTPLQRTTRYHIAREGQALYKVMPPPDGCNLGDYKRANSLTDQFFYTVQAANGGSHIWDERIHTKNRSCYELKRIGVDVGYKVRVCNRIEQANWNDMDYLYYINATRDLVKSIGGTI